MGRVLLIALAAACTARDLDGDGFGLDVDCDDGDPAIYPGAAEACDGVDNNCDGTVDEGVTRTFHADADGDGFGDPMSTVQACEPGEGRVDNALDCDDTAGDVRPGAEEICDVVDNDCDGAIDEGVTITVYLDADGDGFGDPTFPVPACRVGPALAASGADCDDGDDQIHPDADERCDGVDNDCDLLVDEEAVDAPSWYVDGDGDGYGATEIVTCEAPAGTVSTPGDCDDADVVIHPGRLYDDCGNAVDDDCDGLVDNDCPVEHCGTITQDETWGPGPAHRVTCDVVVNGASAPTLTIDDGAVVVFDADTQLVSGIPGVAGRIAVRGSGPGSVLLTSSAAQPAPGDWGGVLLTGTDGGSTFEGMELAWAGGGGVDGSLAVWSNLLWIRDSIVRDGASDGIYVGTSAILDMTGTEVRGHAASGVNVAPFAALAAGSPASFADNVLTDNGGYPIRVQYSDITQLDASTRYSGNAHDQVYAYGSGLSVDAVWQALDVPLFVDGDLSFGGGLVPELVIEDGVVIQMALGREFVVGSSAATLRIEGHTAGVVMESELGDAGTPGDWDGLWLAINNRGSTIEGLRLRHGGGSGRGGITVSGRLDLVDSTVEDNLNHGILVSAGASLAMSGSTVQGNTSDGVHVTFSGELSDITGPTFTGNVVTGNDGVPVSVPAGSLAQLDGTNALAGNALDVVEVIGGAVIRSGTWIDPGMPLWVTDDVSIASVAGPVVTVEPGAELWFDPDVGVTVGINGAAGLIARGTVAQPVVFTSSQPSPAPGDWAGLTLAGFCIDADVQFENVEVRYAGANTFGALRFSGCDGSIEDSVVSDSSTWGIYRSSSSPTITNVAYANNAAGDLF